MRGRLKVYTMRFPHTALVAGIGIVAALTACTRDRAGPFHDEFEPLAARYMEELDIPGLAVVVADRAGVIYRQEWGVQSLADSLPVTANSLFHLASLTKTFTATAVLRLADSGTISLDDAVTAYLPYFRSADSARADITVRQLLSHTSGLPDIRDFSWDAPETDADALERYVRDSANGPLVAAPGAEFHYSNLGYTVLGDLVAKVSRRDFETAMRETVLQPVGMSGSSLLLRDVADRPELTAPHALDSAYQVSVSPVRPYNRPHAASSTLYASTGDMAKWIALHLRRGETGIEPLLSARMYAEMWTPQAGTDGQMGLGWFLGDGGGVETVYHSGADLGYSAYLVLVPERDIGVVVLSNYERAPVRALAQRLLDVALGREPGPLPPTGGLQLDRLLYQEFRASGTDAAERRFHELGEAEEFDFDQVRQLLGLASVFRNEGQPAEAAAVYGLCIELYSEFAWLHELHAAALLAASDSTAAEAAARRALELDPESERAQAIASELGLSL
jgi:CubicO group peptidase (beta-lactamase class C family)